MSELTKQQLEKTASAYEKLMVPALFTSWARKVLDEARISRGDHVLDVACGTGALTRLVAERLDGTGSVTGLDVNPGMLSVAEEIAPYVAWRQGVAEDLPFEEESFDAVVSQFGLMFFEDQEGALSEMYRVLKSEGRLVVAVFDSLDNIPGYDAMVNIFDQVIGEEVAQALRFPFSLGDTNKLESLCNASTLPSSDVTTHNGEADFPDIRSLVLADVRGWFPLAGFELNDDQVHEVVTQAESELKQFIRDDDRVVFPLPCHFITANKSN